jgi:phosphomannomutase/phosphoglucomutase
MGVRAIGMGLGTLIQELGAGPEIVTGHDYRSYSKAIQSALIMGLMAAGAKVKDIGLALSPTAYYAQFALDVPSVAMVTASHNDNGWSGIKMGCERPLTFGPDEMSRLKEIVLNGEWQLKSGGTYEFVENFQEQYIAHLADRPKLKRKIKVIAACGNGTAGAFAPEVLRRIGCEVVEMDATLDHTFPNYNPNPEDMVMLHAMRDKIEAEGADVALGFDGDGDRCGVVDNEGEEIFADKVGVMLARDISALHESSQFVVDVKSTGLFLTDPVLKAQNATTDYWKTGHSYIKRRVNELNAIAGFEKSGHFFFNQPIGLGYDDGIVTALAVCDMLDRNPDKSMADLRRDLPLTFGSPTMSPTCADEVKYDVIERVIARITSMVEAGENIGNHAVKELITVNGIRVVCDDGTWGLIRASSNTPQLVVVVESPISEERKKEMFHALDDILRENDEVGDYNQSL